MGASDRARTETLTFLIVDCWTGSDIPSSLGALVATRLPCGSDSGLSWPDRDLFMVLGPSQSSLNLRTDPTSILGMGDPEPSRCVLSSNDDFDGSSLSAVVE